LPPEAVRGSRDFTTKSDRYSLGVVLYECVTGRAPFAGDSLMALLNAISAGDFLRPSRVRPDISGAMERAILRAMNPEPALRFEHIRDLGRELLDVAGMRTQMLWGRTFGRIDLSEPPPGLRNSSTSPVALVPSPSERPGPAPADPGSKLRYGRHILLGVATLAAILIPNFWAMRTPAPQASPVSPSEAYAAREPRAAARPLTPLIASPAPRQPEPEPALALEHRSPSAPPTDWSSAPRRSDITPTPSLDEPSRALSTERPRANKRARAGAPAADARPPRASLLPEPRPRAGLVRDPDEQRETDDLRQLFLVPGNSREGAPKPVPPGGLGANESPILD
jgi:serine/threonine-protein kinase